MNANEIYVAKANDLYAALGHAMIQKKQLEEQIEDLELQLKGLIIHNPLLQKVEQDTLASLSKEPEEDSDGKL
jgi:5,10-methylene-tetrahydrofolate dehydrogenase/methenyl tetrahydrofolate cyclohydrolase